MYGIIRDALEAGQKAAMEYLAANAQNRVLYQIDLANRQDNDGRGALKEAIADELAALAANSAELQERMNTAIHKVDDE